MIPRTIHYCWFGGRPMPRRLKRNIAHWAEVMPGVRIVRWDESNFDVRSIPYVAQAYAAGKWAYVADYVRLDVVVRQGGIYLDTDVDLLRPLDPLLKLEAFCARENDCAVNTGLGFGAVAGHPLIQALRDAYMGYSFPSPPCTVLQTAELEARGLTPSDAVQVVDGLTVLPKSYFNATDEYGIPRPVGLTYAIHHAEASWMPWPWRLMKRMRLMAEGNVPTSVLVAMVRFKRWVMGEWRCPTDRR